LEIKTFLDNLKRSNKVRKSLFEEIKTTMKNRKTVKDINEALTQNADAVLLFLTFSSFAIGLAKYSDNDFGYYMFENSAKNLKRSLDEENSSVVPILIICSVIDTLLCNYRIISFCINYSIVTDKNGKRECNKSLLDLRNFK
jgi:nucleoid-associated protein YejK